MIWKVCILSLLLEGFFGFFLKRVVEFNLNVWKINEIDIIYWNFLLYVEFVVYLWDNMFNILLLYMGSKNKELKLMFVDEIYR